MISSIYLKSKYDKHKVFLPLFQEKETPRFLLKVLTYYFNGLRLHGMALPSHIAHFPRQYMMLK